MLYVPRTDIGQIKDADRPYLSLIEEKFDLFGGELLPRSFPENTSQNPFGIDAPEALCFFQETSESLIFWNLKMNYFLF